MSAPKFKYFIKRPRTSIGEKAKPGSQKIFSLYRQVVNEDGTTQNETQFRDDIDSVNRQYLDGVLSFEQALTNIKSIQKKLYREAGVQFNTEVFNAHNEALLKRYWDKIYGPRDIGDRDSALGKLRKAIRALGNVAIASATLEQLQSAIDAHKFENNKQREIVNKLNALLKFAGRDERLAKKKKSRSKVKYLSEADMLTVVANLKLPELQTMSKLAFYSGLRQGELMALTLDSKRAKGLWVESQLDKEDVERDPKWGSKRLAFVIPEGRSLLETWVGEKHLVQNIARTTISKHFRLACRRTFPNERAKWCKFHDLRHSYAIALLKQGVNMSLVAQSLGNSIAVCQEYYAGFSLNDDTIDTVDRMFKKDE